VTSTTDSSPRAGSSAAGEPAALAAWIAVNSLSLLLSAQRWALWPGSPRPIESVAACQLLCIDAIVAGLYCPVLLSPWRRTVLVALATAPFAAFAGFLAGTPLSLVAAGYLVLIAWMVLLALWMAALPEPRWRMIVVAWSGTWTLGLAMQIYLESEFFPGGNSVSGSIASWSPLGIVISLLGGQVPNVFAITLLAIFLGAGIAVYRGRTPGRR
jgi:hypothetical protein